MTRRQRSVLLACWLALQLLLGQQLALAHMVGHLGDALAHVAAGAGADASGEGGEHGGAEALTHACTTCAGGLGAGLMPGTVMTASFDAGRAAHGQCRAVSPAPTFCSPAPFRSRAPPSLQS